MSFGLDGSLMVWDYNTHDLIGLHYFEAPVTSLACNPDEVLLAVGFQTGSVGLVDLQTPSTPRLIFVERLHDSPVISVRLIRSWSA